VEFAICKICVELGSPIFMNVCRKKGTAADCVCVYVLVAFRRRDKLCAERNKSDAAACHIEFLSHVKGCLRII